MIGFTPGWAASWNSFEWNFGLMAGIQALGGSLFLIVAIATLRPLRGSAWPGGKPQTGWFTRIRTRFRQVTEARATAALTRNTAPGHAKGPPLVRRRSDALEGAIHPHGGRAEMAGQPAGCPVFIVLLCCYLADMSASVVVDLFSGTRRTRIWEEINLGLRTSTAALAVLAILPIGAAAASSITSEREGDTWISLATTLLTPREVIRGKQFGAVWSARWLGIGLICILAAGLVLGVVHPIGLAAGVAILVTCRLAHRGDRRSRLDARRQLHARIILHGGRALRLWNVHDLAVPVLDDARILSPDAATCGRARS